MFSFIKGIAGIDFDTMKNIIDNLDDKQLTTLVEKLNELLQSNIKLPSNFKNDLQKTLNDIVNSDMSTWKDKLITFISDTNNFDMLSSFGPQIMQALGLK